MNITVFGPNGMLGQAVMKAIVAQGHTPNPIESRIQDAITGQVRGSVVINCAGRVHQKQATDSDMVLSNAYGPQLLANVCDLAGVRLVRVSTDCVFSHDGPNNEMDTISPVSVYGISKAAGEVTRDPHLTVRVSFVGEGSHGLVHDLRTKQVVEASSLLLWSGHTVRVVADQLVKLSVMASITGLLHFPGEDSNRYGLATLLAAHLGLKSSIKHQREFVADRRLASVRWTKLGLPTLPDFRTQLATGGLG